MDEQHSRRLMTVAQMYYIQAETMESIAHQIGVSRSTVSRLLKEARETGLVQVKIVDPAKPLNHIAEQFSRRFGITAHLVRVRPGASSLYRLDQVSKLAADVLGRWVTDGDVLGIAWGTTVEAVARHLRPRALNGVMVTGMNGGANHQTTGLPYTGTILAQFAQAFGGQEQLFALPAFFDDPATRAAMWKERSTRHMLRVRSECRIALFGVGSLDSELQSHVYSANYLSGEDLAELRRDRVVGDVCTVMVRSDGSWRDIPINQRATGITPSELRTIPKRLCVVAGTSKVAPLLGALRLGVMTDLVIDEETARETLRRMDAHGG
ncbi:sugar-binding transcriptional regulator [Tessaracoccus caeni]|uniref:sugar-binding transcriptional regulator n=1 Tax=Tessaracoccus caeni TaxID=3031239 RepID=UPI0023D9D0D1|nr:sugar-binding domain-containing protein [Tessaracoccus caeni]MDF1487436.1 sugar-binding domain-containing protein [Tessaracoccus caeni]